LSRPEASGSPHPSECRRSDNLSSLALTIQQSVGHHRMHRIHLAQTLPYLASFSASHRSAPTRQHITLRGPASTPAAPETAPAGSTVPLLHRDRVEPSSAVLPRTFRPTSSVAKDNGQRST
ncbi:hypothetical protein CABS01_09651, partial [Colletotrichum abscissum]|uniref:uncharacterized protein n=1 Tax=Colletotrichum abscissum TaxID=1671311 RepID=UPI0027D6D998